MVGQIVIHKVFGKGTVIRMRNIGDHGYIDVEFSVGEKSFSYPSVFATFLRMNDPEKQTEIENDMKRMEDERRKAAREAELQACTEKCTPQFPTDCEPFFERLTDDRRYFIVFQNRPFDVESKGQYLWCPKADSRGGWCHHWKRLTEVKKGDIIFHCCSGEIRAVSEADIGEKKEKNLMPIIQSFMIQFIQEIIYRRLWLFILLAVSMRHLIKTEQAIKDIFTTLIRGWQQHFSMIS